MVNLYRRVALLLAVVAGSGLAALLVSRAGSSATNVVVGHAYFTSSGAASGANNMKAHPFKTAWPLSIS